MLKRAVLLAALGVVLVPAGASAASPEPLKPYVARGDSRGQWLCAVKLRVPGAYCYVIPRAELRTTSWWGIAKCGVAIGAFIAGNAVAVAKLRKAGGVWKIAKRVLRAKGKEAKAEALAAIFGELSGLTGVVSACGG